MNRTTTGERISDFSDPFLTLEFFALEFDVSTDHLQNISLAQRGLMNGGFSEQTKARYPKFVKGPAGRLGMYASQYSAWREKQNAPLPRTA